MNFQFNKLEKVAWSYNWSVWREMHLYNPVFHEKHFIQTYIIELLSSAHVYI